MRGCGEVWITGGEKDRVDAASCEWFWKGRGFVCGCDQ